MLRSFFIYLSKASWARKIVTGWSFAWRMVSRFVPGETLGEAIQTIKALNDKNINATLDHLGEHTDSPEMAVQATNDIILALDAIQSSGVRANVSLKLTQIGLGVSPDLCAENLERIVAHASKLNNFVRVDMEDSPVTQITLDIMRKVRQKGYDNVGIVIQSYLYRSEQDIRDLVSACIPVRLCKGAYKEPAAVAFPKKRDVDTNYDKLASMLMDGAKENGCPPVSVDGRFPPLPGLATHDEKRVQYAKEYARKVELPQNSMEFQMLYGIRRELQEQLAQEGYPVRIYVPYGTEWYPYYMRRLAERPANVWFIVSNFFKK
jgi:proline dehydrogenase